ncbi:hypothetical protein JN09_000690 [Acholeplasma morum]|uniref:hypothetical protein n=1 Tax=Paracholeplasma morum TaxID=264637 RepID=UPI0019574FC0|nr:hypothetical protein [Paracholeplasma morum]MBM7453364.1 hypothetical protein [Paracholeplasma morum]
MTIYADDRRFTDYIHKFLAIPLIYQALDWIKEDVPKEIIEALDLKSGIDYILKDIEGNIKTVQERFRDQKYQSYNDFTLRYRRDYNMHDERKESEFFKIDAEYMVYGITNGNKNHLDSVSDFIKFAVIDLKLLFQYINEGFIRLDSSIKTCQVISNLLYAPINHNVDYSSSFVAFDVKMLHELFPYTGIIMLQKGFF